MNESLLTIGAVLFELGLPVALIYLCFKFTGKRKILIPIIGAITPVFLFLIVGSIVELLSLNEQPSMWWAAFIMSLFVYIILALVGLAVGLLLLSSVSLNRRFGIAFCIGPACGLVFFYLESMLV